MMFNRDEKEAARIDRAHADELWAALGAANQTEALDKISTQTDWKAIANSGSDKEREAWSIERQKFQQKIQDQFTELERADAQINRYLDRLREPIVSSNVGKKTIKVTGYGYPGEIVAEFKTKAGNQRFVVEATGMGYEGMLHIFSPEQIEIETEKPIKKDWSTIPVGEYRAIIDKNDKWAKYGTVRASVTVDDFDKAMTETRKKLFGVT